MSKKKVKIIKKKKMLYIFFPKESKQELYKER